MARPNRYWAITLIFSCSLANLSMADGKKDQTDLQRGEAVLKSFTKNQGVPAGFQQLQNDFPELATMVQDFAMGQVWSRDIIDAKTSQLIALAGFAAQGDWPQFKAQAQYAINFGATPEELMEVVYITTVTSGFSKSLNAAYTLKALFAENGMSFSGEGVAKEKH